MPLSPKILRGIDIRGWKTYEPRVPEEGKPGDDLKENALMEPQLPPPPTREEIEKERTEILAAARQEGERIRRQILAKAGEEATVLRERAIAEGYGEGYARGEQEAEKLREEAAHTLKRAKEEHRNMLDGAEEEILRIAVSMAEKLVHVQVELNEDVILAMLVRCLESLPGGRELVLRVNPRDEQLCRSKGQMLQGLLRRDASLQIVADADLPSGSCIVESEEAEVAFLLQKELEILTKKLLALAVDRGQRTIG
ncbi:MAG: FliH/SctL family protein [Bacillota bacterium]